MAALIKSFYNETQALLNQQPPTEWDYEKIEKSQETIKAARIAEMRFSRIAVAGILIGAIAIKTITSPIWVPTVFFAGLTALVCFILSLKFNLLISKFQKWKDLPDDQLQDIFIQKLLDAIQYSRDYDDLAQKCMKIESNLSRPRLIEFKNITSHFQIIFNFQFSEKNKLQLLWEANKRHLLIIFPRHDQIENQEFVLDYTQHIFIQIRSDQAYINKFPELIFHKQFKLLNLSEDGQSEWDGIKVIENKMVVVVAQYFPLDKLLQTCNILKKNIRVGIIIHPGNDEYVQKLQKISSHLNVRILELNDEEAQKFCLANVKYEDFFKISQ